MPTNETKPIDRDKPFRRIGNQAIKDKLNANKPDGNGVACGCHTPADFGDATEELKNFLKGKVPTIKTLTDILQKIRDIIDTVQKVEELVLAIGAAIAPLLGPIPGGILAIPAIIAAITTAAKAIINLILDGVDEALGDFFAILGRRVLPRAIRTIPQWVPVIKGASNSKVTAEQIFEVEGVCTRSFANPIDVPFFNWHFWFNWNIQVKPEPDYENIISVSNPPNKDKFAASERPLFKEGSFEIQWDTGFLTADRSPHINGFPASETHINDGPMIQGEWIWPMAGMYVWAAGRWVYDCSRVTSDSDPKMCTMLNPAKALATARSQAFSFAENEASVPAIQFMFVSSKRGGKDPLGSAQAPYIGYETINDTDYEFILDLPSIDFKSVPFPIGHTPDFPHNTIVVRPRLLKDLRQLPMLGGAPIEPIIELLHPDDPNKPPAQVKIKVPMTSLDSSAEACGFVLSLGWFDPNLEQARKVKKCKLAVDGFSGRLQIRDSPIQKLRGIFKGEEDRLKQLIRDRVGNIKIIDLHIPLINKNITIRLKDLPLVGKLIDDLIAEALTALIEGLVTLLPLEKEEWLLHIGVNGQWRSHFFDGVGSSPVDLRESNFDLVRDKFIFDLQLAEGDTLSFAVHGTEFDPVGDIMHSSRSNRILTTNDQPIGWDKIADPNIDKQLRRELVFESVLKMLTDSTGGVSKLALGFDNSPLGIIDPDHSAKSTAPENNPVVIKDDFNGKAIRRTARFARAVGDQMILAEDMGKADYTLSYTLDISDLLPK